MKVRSYMLLACAVLSSRPIAGLQALAPKLPLASQRYCFLKAHANGQRPTPKTSPRPFCPIEAATHSKRGRPASARGTAKALLISALVTVTLTLCPHQAAAATAAAAESAPLPAELRRVLALLLASSAVGMWAEKNTRLGSIVSGAMTTFFFAMILSGVGFLPSATAHPLYQVVWTQVVPLALCLLMLGLDKASVLSAIRQSSGMLKAFAVASLGTIVGSFIAYTALAPVLPQAWKLAAVFSATYIGGTVNFLATADAVRLRDPVCLASAFSADMFAMAFYFGVLFFIGRRLDRGAAAGGSSITAGQLSEAELQPQASDAEKLSATPEGFVTSLAVAATITSVSFAAAQPFRSFDAGIPIATAIALGVAVAAPGRVRESWSASSQLVGTLFIQLFFATIGATTDVHALLSSAAVWPLFAMVFLILGVHGTVLHVVGQRLMKLDVKDLLLASNAAVGGPATAAAMAAALGWKNRVSPAIMCGTLGYAIGTVAGMAVGFVCNGFSLAAP